MTEKVAASAAELWKKTYRQPLGHELFREAAEQQLSNPRSCLVLAVAAAEVGFKQLVGNLVPDAKWLADNAPSPPLVTMLKKYLPMLPTRIHLKGAKPKIPGRVIKVLQEAVELRNQVVHGKSKRISSKTLEKILAAVHDCLYLFDAYNGHVWAFDRISVENQKLILKESG